MTLDLIYHLFVIFSQPSKYVLDLIFVIKWFSKQRQLIKTHSEALKVVIDRLGTFGPCFDLLFELLDVSPTWLSVGQREGGPYVCRCGGRRQPRLNGESDSAQQSTVNEAILSLPDRVGRVGSRHGVNSVGGGRDNNRSVDVAGKIIPIEEGMNLTAPHQKVGGRKLCDVCHIDIENGLSIGDGDGLVMCSSHEKNEEEKGTNLKGGGWRRIRFVDNLL